MHLRTKIKYLSKRIIANTISVIATYGFIVFFLLFCHSLGLQCNQGLLDRTMLKLLRGEKEFLCLPSPIGNMFAVLFLTFVQFLLGSDPNLPVNLVSVGNTF